MPNSAYALSNASIINISLFLDGSCTAADPTLFRVDHQAQGEVSETVGGDQIGYLIVDDNGRVLESESAFEIPVGVLTNRFTIVGTRADPTAGAFSFFLLDRIPTQPQILAGTQVVVVGNDVVAGGESYEIGASLDFDASLLDPDCPSADQTAPSLTAVTILSNNADPTVAREGDVITVSITADETITTPTVAIAGEAALVAGSGASYTATLTVSGSTTEGGASIDISNYQDGAGNAGATVTSLTGGSSVSVDRTAPTVTLSTTTSPISGPFTLEVIFSENVTGMELSDFAVGNGAASNLTGSGTTYEVTITPSGIGTVTVDLATDAAADAVGNGNSAAAQFSGVVNSEVPSTRGFSLRLETGP